MLLVGHNELLTKHLDFISSALPYHNYRYLFRNAIQEFELPTSKKSGVK